MKTVLLSVVSLLLINFASCIHDTTCQEDQKHFADVCFTPQPVGSLDVGFLLGEQPEDGWYVPMSNDIGRLHFTESLKGQILTLQDNFDDACFKIKFGLGETGLEGNLTGFGNLRGSWNCTLSKDTPNLFLCDAKTDGPSKFHENFNLYPVYIDNKNVMFGVVCFPNGQAGWGVFSGTPTLTDAEKKHIAEQTKELGFVYEDHVMPYGETCKN